jgi:hypothetical protein
MMVGEVARRLGVPPRLISYLLYQRRLPDEAYPIVGGRRIIPLDRLDEVAAAVREHLSRRGATPCTT